MTTQPYTTLSEFRLRYPIRVGPDTLLGSGTYGKVVKVEDQVETEWVAVKISEYKGDDVRSLRAEVELARNVPRQANIARYDACYRLDTDTGTSDFAIMRYYPDGNLAEFMRANVLDQTQIDQLVRGILQGLQHLHRHRIVHRDFKPANILISRDNRGRIIPKIADFGLSKLVRDDEIDSSDFDLSDGRGTPSYKAPEQIEGGRVSFNLDLWAFGVILYELLTGEKPFSSGLRAGSEQSVKRAIELKITAVRLPERLQSISEPYQTIIRRCLVKDIRQRVRKEAELFDWLDGVQPLLVQAQGLVVDGKYTEALLSYEAVLALRPDNNIAIQGIDTCHDGLEQLRRAGLLEEADALYEAARWQQAIDTYLTLLAADSAYPGATNGLNKAREALAREEHIAALRLKADICFGEQNFVLARETYLELQQLQPDQPSVDAQISACNEGLTQQQIAALLIEGDQLVDQQTFNVAQTRYRAVLDLDPTNKQANQQLLVCEEGIFQQTIKTMLLEAHNLFAATSFAEACHAYEQILTLAPTNVAAKAGKAASEEGLKQQKIAVLTAKANTLLQRKNTDEAKALFEQALTLDLQNNTIREQIRLCDELLLKHKVSALLDRAAKLVSRKAFNEARQVCEEVLILAADNLQATQQLAVCEAGLKQQQLTNWLRNADTYLTRKEYADAKEIYALVLASEPENKPARKGMARCEAALALPIAEPTDLFVGPTPTHTLPAEQPAEDATDLFINVPTPAAAANQPAGKQSGKPVAGLDGSVQPGKPARPFWQIAWPIAVVLLMAGIGYAVRVGLQTPDVLPIDTKPVAEDTTLLKPATEPVVTLRAPKPATALAAPVTDAYRTALDRARQEKARQNWQSVLYYATEALRQNPASREARQLLMLARSETQQKQEIAQRQAAQQQATQQQALTAQQNQQAQAQTEHDELIDKGMSAALGSNNKGVATSVFAKAKQLAEQYNLATSKATAAYARCVAKGDGLMKLDEYEGAKAWYVLAQLLVNTADVRKKIKDCNTNL